jgi:predicted O-methyltransferase YrrM
MKSVKLDDNLYTFFQTFGYREQPLLKQIREYAEQHPRFRMLSTPDTAQLLYFLIKLTRAQQVLEIGCFLGYSAAAMALALPENGKVVTLELQQEYADIAHDFWQQGAIDHKIECVVGNACDSLNKFHENQFDFIFIDANKTAYIDYYEQSLHLLKAGGLIAIDNMFHMNRVANPDEKNNGTKAIQKLNQLIKKDNRVEMLTLTVGDGVTLAIKL